MARPDARKITVSIFLLLLSLAVAIFSFYILTSVFDIIPVQFNRLVDAIFVAVVIYFIFRTLRAFIARYLSQYDRLAKFHPVLFFVTLIGYFVLGVGFLAALGVDVSSVILGGSLVSVIIGLASQTVLANQFAGIMLSVVRPFKVGDYITINTWQYGGTFPVLYPKYFSSDRIESTAYSGEVVDITVNYTTIRLDSDDVVKIPNGTVVQGSIIIREKAVQVKVRYEVPKYISFDAIEPLMHESVSSMQDFSGKIRVTIDEATINTYVVMIIARFNSVDADSKRSTIIRKLMEIIEPMKAE